MLKNYFKIALRNLLKNKGYSLVATIGLSVGVACCILVGLYVYHEFSYESHHEYADQIYRVGSEVNLSGTQRSIPYTARLLGPTAEEQIPEVQNYTHLSPQRDAMVQYGEITHYEDDLYFTDDSVLEVFTISFKQGNPETALSSPGSIVISETMTQKYFGNDDPMGKTLTVLGKLDLTVTGVIENPPTATNHPFHFLAYRSGQMPPNWNALTNTTTYLLMNSGINPGTMEEKLIELQREHSDTPLLEAFVLDRLDRMHLYASISPTGDIRYIYIFSLVALFLLIIANINHINLSITQLIPRSREVGIRKTLGAQRSQLTLQYLTETFLISLFAIGFALVLAESMVPLVDALPGITLAPLALDDYRLWLILISMAIIITLFSGSYITFYLARLNPASIFQKRGQLSPGSNMLRKGLIVFQFAVSITLICCTFIVQSQLSFIQDARLGFDEDHLLVLNLDGDLREQYEVLRQEIEGLSGVESVSASNGVPGDAGFVTIFLGDEYPVSTVNIMGVGKSFPSQIGMTWQTPEPQNLNDGDWVLNASAAEILGLSELQNQRIEQLLGMEEEDQDNFRGEVAGVVDDFNYQSLRSEIEPILMRVNSESFSKLAIRFQPGRVSDILDQIRTAWEEFAPGVPMDYSFLDDRIESMYQSDRRFARIFWGFSLITIVIACMGLFGLAALAAERRTKEIGIRKVLGASVSGIVALLGKDFIKLVIISFLIAVPVSWYYMNQWLQDFAYRIEIGAGIFLLAGTAAVFIALATVSWQSIRAALANPVDSLRSE